MSGTEWSLAVGQNARQTLRASSILGYPSSRGRSAVVPCLPADKYHATVRRCSLTLPVHLSFRYCSEERRDKPFYESKNHFDRMNLLPGTGMGGVLTLVPRDETRWLPDWRGGFTRWMCFRVDEPVVVLMFVVLLWRTIAWIVVGYCRLVWGEKEGGRGRERCISGIIEIDCYGRQKWV